MTQPPLLRFWVVLVITTVPFYLWGSSTDGELVVSGAHLPISAIMFVCPAVAALAAGGGRAAAWRRMLAPPSALWLVLASVVPAALLMIASVAVAGTGSLGISVSLVMVAGAYLVAALCEELGWSAVLMPALLRTHGVLYTGAVIGVIWALWHLIPYLQAGYGSAMLLGQLGFTVAFRMLLVQMTVFGGGAPIIAVAGHASSNVVWTLLAAGGIYSPIASAVAVGLVVVVLAVDRIHEGRCNRRSWADR